MMMMPADGRSGGGGGPGDSSDDLFDLPDAAVSGRSSAVPAGSSDDAPAPAWSDTMYASLDSSTTSPSPADGAAAASAGGVTDRHDDSLDSDDDFFFASIEATPDRDDVVTSRRDKELVANAGTRSIRPGRVLHELRLIEKQLDEMPECSSPLVRLLDGFVEPDIANFRAAIIAFAELAMDHLEKWDAKPTAIEIARLKRLTQAGESEEAVHEACLDLKVCTQYLARVRPEDFLDMGSWRLYRDVRACVATNDIQFLAGTLHRLDAALAVTGPDHLLAPYQPRLVERYTKLVELELERVIPLLDLEPTSQEPEAIADALMQLERGASYVAEMQKLYPHALLDYYAGEFVKRRKQWMPALHNFGTAAMRNRDLVGIGRGIASYDRLDAGSASHRELAQWVIDLGNTRERILDELALAAQKALGVQAPGPAYTAMRGIEAVPDDLRPPDSELATLLPKLRAHHDRLLKSLTDRVDDMVFHGTPQRADEIPGLIAEIDAYLDHHADHPLARRRAELVALRERLLHDLGTAERLRRALEALKEKVRVTLANPALDAAAVRRVADEVSAEAIVPAELKAPLLARVLERAARLAALEAASRATDPTVVEQRLSEVMAGLTADDRAVLGPRIDAVQDHRAALIELLAAMQSLLAWRKQLADDNNPERLSADGQQVVTDARLVLNTHPPGHGLPGTVELRERLQKASDECALRLATLKRLLELPLRVRHKLRLERVTPTNGNELPIDPDFASGGDTLDNGRKELGAELREAPGMIAALDAGAQLYDTASQIATRIAAFVADCATRVREGRVDAKFAQQLEAAAGPDADLKARDVIARVDRWLQARGELIAWYDSRRSRFAVLAKEAATHLDAAAARRRRRRRMILAAVALLLLVGGGLFAWWFIEQRARQQRADELLAQVQRAQHAERIDEIDASIGESVAFLDEGTNRREFHPLDEATDALRDRRKLVETLSAEYARIRKLAEDALATGEGMPDALTELVGFQRDRALPGQRLALEPLRIDLLAALAARRGLPGLTATTEADVKQAIADVNAAVTSSGEAKVATHPRVREMLDKLQARQDELIAARIRELGTPGLAPDATVDIVRKSLADIDAALAGQSNGVRQLVEPVRRQLRQREINLTDAIREAALQARVAELRARLQHGRATLGDDLEQLRKLRKEVQDEVDKDPLRNDLLERLAPDFAHLQQLIDYLRLINTLRTRIEKLLQGIDGLGVVGNDYQQMHDAIDTTPVPEGRPPVTQVLGGLLADLDRRYQLLRDAAQAEQRASEPDATALSVLDLHAGLTAELAKPGSALHRRALQPPLERLLVRAGRLFVDELDRLVGPALNSEDPAVIKPVIARLREVQPRLTDEALRTRVRAAIDVLGRRAAWFEKRVATKEKALALLDDPAPLATLQPKVQAITDALAELDAAVGPVDQFGAPPSRDAALRDAAAVLALRVKLLQAAAGGMLATTVPPVEQAIRTIEAGLATPPGAASESRLAKPLDDLRRWLALLELIAAVKDSADPTTIRETVRKLDDELARPADPEPAWRAPLQKLRDELKDRADRLSLRIEMQLPPRTIDQSIEVSGRVSSPPGVALPREVVLLVNGADVTHAAVGAGGAFSCKLPLKSGENVIVATPDGNADHPAAVRATIISETPHLTIAAPDRVDRRETVVTGEVHGATLNQVWFFVNGDSRPVEVVDGKFEVTVILLAGENVIVASPINDVTHNGAATHKLFADISRSAVNITLTWDPPDADMDLFMRQSNGVEVWWRNRDPGGINGSLDVDKRREGGPENYSFTLRPGQKMPAGHYEVFVIYYAGQAADVTCTLRVRWNEGTPDAKVLEPKVVRVRRALLRQPIKVYEFDVPE
ncbi:MAG: hypothetical protein AB7K09_18220 [Planctomycetota bacterium]